MCLTFTSLQKKTRGGVLTFLPTAPSAMGIVSWVAFTFAIAKQAAIGSKSAENASRDFRGTYERQAPTMVPFLLITWVEWRSQYPENLVLLPEPGYSNGYAGMAQRIASIQYGCDRNPARPLIREQDSRLPNDEQIMGIGIDNAHEAYPRFVPRPGRPNTYLPGFGEWNCYKP